MNKKNSIQYHRIIPDARDLDDHLAQLPDHSIADQSSVTGHWNRFPREVVDAPGLSVPKKKKQSAFGYALHNGIHFLVSPDVVRQLDWMITVGP